MGKMHLFARNQIIALNLLNESVFINHLFFILGKTHFPSQASFFSLSRYLEIWIWKNNFYPNILGL